MFVLVLFILSPLCLSLCSGLCPNGLSTSRLIVRCWCALCCSEKDL